MEPINKQLKNRIMMRIYFRFFLNKVFAPMPVKLYIMASLAGFLVSNVSINNVITNMPHGIQPIALYNFSVSAFANTELVVHILLAGMLITVSLLVRDILNSRLGSNLNTA